MQFYKYFTQLIPIFKKGDHNDCRNYSGISLLNTLYKLHASIFRTPLNAIKDAMLSQAQNSYMKGRSCLDFIFTIAQLEKSRKYQLPAYIAFIDFEKAFDRLNRSKL